MNEVTKKACEQLIENRDILKDVFSWESGMMHLAAAGACIGKDRVVEKEALEEAKNILKDETGVLSDFRGAVKLAVIVNMALSDQPRLVLEKSIEVHKLLKKEFFGSAYLPYTAMVISQMTEPEQYETVIGRTKAIYKKMKENHPFLTSSEDSAFCALLALSDKSDEALLEDMEACYQLLKGNFFFSNAVQSLSHVLALCDGTPEEKCQKTMTLFNMLKEKGVKYGTDYELPSLGVLAVNAESLEAVADNMLEIDKWLSKQKDFGLLGISAKQRLMYAGILAQKDVAQSETMQTAAVSGVVSMVIAQEAAMCAAIVAGSTAASAAN